MNKFLIRLVNFLIDTATFTILVVLFVMFFKNIIDQKYVKWISILIYFLYYFLFEYFLHQTPGKMVTKSKVVSLTENHSSYFFQVILRTIMRFIPLDIFSYLFSYRGFHDRISKTTVTKL